MSESVRITKSHFNEIIRSIPDLNGEVSEDKSFVHVPIDELVEKVRQQPSNLAVVDRYLWEELQQLSSVEDRMQYVDDLASKNTQGAVRVLGNLLALLEDYQPVARSVSSYLENTSELLSDKRSELVILASSIEAIDLQAIKDKLSSLRDSQ